LLGEIIWTARTAGKLNDQAFTHKVGTMEGRDNVPGIRFVFVFNEAEAIHELDLGYFSGTMSPEVRFDIGLGGVAWNVSKVQTGRRNLVKSARHAEIGNLNFRVL
jgi:hypothetical protein